MDQLLIDSYRLHNNMAEEDINEEEESSFLGDLGENIGQALEERFKDAAEAAQDLQTKDMPKTVPIIGSPQGAEMAFRLAGHLAGALFNDVAGETMSTVGRRHAPKELQDAYDETVEGLATAFSESEAGKSYLKYLEDNPDKAKNLDALLNVSAFVPATAIAGKTTSIIGKGASNLPAKINIYGSGAQAAAELTKAGGISLGRTIKETLSPQRRAARREMGMSPSKIEEASKRFEAGEGDYATTALMQAHLIARQNPGGKYPEGFEKSALVRKNIEPEGLDIPATDKKTISRIMQGGVNYTIPQAVLNRIINKVPDVHFGTKSAPRNNMSVNVNRLGNPSGMASEAAPTVTKNNVTKKTVDQASPFTRILRDPKGKSHPLKYAENIDKPLKKWSRKDWTTYLTDELAMSKDNLSFFRSGDRRYVSFANQSHNSKNKTLGGVNNYYIIDITGGRNDIISYNTISDLHDLKVAGRDLIPPGGSHILNIFPPVKHNISKYMTYNRSGVDIETQETLRLVGNKKVKKEVEELLERSKSIKPTLKDRMDSARVVATVGAVPLSPLLAQDAGDNTRSLLGRR